MTTDLSQEKTIQITTSDISETKTSSDDHHKEVNPMEYYHDLKDQYTIENQLEIKTNLDDPHKEEKLTKIYHELINIFTIYLRADAGVRPQLYALKNFKKSIVNVIGNSNTCDTIIFTVIKTVVTKLSSYCDTITLLDLYQNKSHSENHSCGLIDLLHYPKIKFRQFFKTNISKVDTNLINSFLNLDEVIDELTVKFIEVLPNILKKFDDEMKIEVEKTKQFASNIMTICSNEKLSTAKQLSEVISLILNLTSDDATNYRS